MIIRITKLKVFIAVSIFLTAALISGICTDTVKVSATADTVELPIIMYHQITTNPAKKGKYSVTLDELEKDFLYIKKCGYTAINIEELLDYAYNGADLPEKPIMITFDDGRETMYEYLLPLLEKLDMKAVIAVIGSATDLFTERTDHHLSYSHLNWEKVNALVQSKHIEIQNHSYDMHSNKNGRNGMRKKIGESYEKYKEVLKEDLMKFQNLIFKHTNYLPTAVVYPFGEYSKETPEILRELGFKAALTCEGKVNKISREDCDYWLFRLGRFNRASGKSSEEFFKKILA